jgi:hypothetical protein
MTTAKTLYAATAMVLVGSTAHADFTTTVKCGAKASPTQNYVMAAIAKAEKEARSYRQRQRLLFGRRDAETRADVWLHH